LSRIIFSLYSEDINECLSSSEYKRNQFKKYKSHLEKAHRDYAKLCNASYKLYNIIVKDYDEIQFLKIKMLEELSEIYDEVLYLDFDVVPQTDKNYFEFFDMNKISGYLMNRSPLYMQILKWKVNENLWDRMNVYAKGCAKRSMLMLHNMSGDDTVINTGVLGGNREAIRNLSFTKRLPEAYKCFEEACKDNLYPDEISKCWKPNNEVFITYMIEKYNVPFTDICMPWNFMLDDYSPKGGESSHFLHHIRKEFEISFGEINA